MSMFPPACAIRRARPTTSAMASSSIPKPTEDPEEGERKHVSIVALPSSRGPSMVETSEDFPGRSPRSLRLSVPEAGQTPPPSPGRGLALPRAHQEDDDGPT